MVDPLSPLLKIGKFEAIVDVGRGGFGIVFKARDPELDRVVALKLCRARPSAIDALLDEARLQAKLDRYPNIVTIYDQGRHDGAAFIAMQFIAGQNAERFAERDPAPSVQEILRVYRHVARGLAAAHREKIVHGDIKPSNFLLDRDDFARIADFGLARRVIEDADESEQEGLRRRAGTLYYMAPEALCGEPCDARSDQFSFFVALCQTLSGGKLPFCGKTSGEVLDAIEHTDILQFLGPWVPAELKAVIRIGLSIDPSERFPDMETVEAEIDLLLQTPPPSTPPRDEPEPDESDEPESDEFDEPERMHEPELPDEPALKLGELEVMATPPREGPELTPLGGGASPSPAKRGTFVVALLMVGALGWWVGATRSESPSRNEPVSLPSPLPSPSPCARGWSNVDLDPMVVAVCELIRRDEFEEAGRVWDVEHQIRQHRQHPALAEHTLIVARTFVHRAIAIEQANPDGAKAAAQRALTWALGAAALLSHGDDDIRVKIVIWRAKKFDD
jgi:serine/threonine protein kinase